LLQKEKHKEIMEYPHTFVRCQVCNHPIELFCGMGFCNNCLNSNQEKYKINEFPKKYYRVKTKVSTKPEIALQKFNKILVTQRYTKLSKTSENRDSKT